MDPRNRNRRPQLLYTAGVIGCAALACLLASARYNGEALPLGTALAAALPPVCGPAVLAGSIFIFVVLCLVMYFSRKVDWYNLNNPEEQSKSEQKTIAVKQNTSHDETSEPHHQVSDSLDTDSL